MGVSKDPMTKHTDFNLQLSQKLAPWVVSTLPNCEEILQILKFLFPNSDFIDSEELQHCKVVVEKKLLCYT